MSNVTLSNVSNFLSSFKEFLIKLLKKHSTFSLYEQRNRHSEKENLHGLHNKYT